MYIQTLYFQLLYSCSISSEKTNTQNSYYVMDIDLACMASV